MRRKKERKEKDREFLRYNKRNVLTNLLQAEEHIKAMNTLSFIEGEGSCVLKHLLLVRGELSEAIAHSKDAVERETFGKILRSLEVFLENVERGKTFKKYELLSIVRGWRKEFEQTCDSYLTFACKCLHAIPYVKIALVFALGAAVGSAIATLSALLI